MKKILIKSTKHTIGHYLATFLVILAKSLISSVFWIVTGAVGYFIFAAKRTPYDLIAGLPLMLIGGGMVINSLLGPLYALFSPKYNRGVCVFCNPQ